jgi:lysozyme
MDVSERGLNLIAEFEGFSPIPYDDPDNHCTVGFGELIHLGPCTPADMARPPITREQGFAFLRMKVRGYADAVERYSRPLTQNEFDALTSFCYNVGPSGYSKSSVRIAVNNYGDVRAALLQYVYGVSGKYYPGLERRRRMEAALFYEEEVMTPEERAQVDSIKADVAAIKALAEALVPPLVTGTKAENTAKYIWAAAGKPWPGGK